VRAQCRELRLDAAKACKKDVACYQKLLSDKDGAKAEKAAQMLSRLGQPGVDALAGAINVPDPNVRMIVIVSLAQAHKGSPALRDALSKQIELDEGKPMLKKAGIVDEERVLLASLGHT